MFTPQAAFSGFSVDNLEIATTFYTEILGLHTKEQFGGIQIQLPNDATVWAYVKPDHQPATYTMLNFVVADIDATVDELTKRGVKFIHYDMMADQQDTKGIMRGRAQKMGPDIAWFTDPAGNILSVLQKED